ncbi:MAG: glycine--tRNA ligase subunit beta, partial [Endozoicomonadaceae bacterium]|nr:glycine--tRNA ligase subunit beta [Endozoicomonadaceae bacterium]
MTKSDLTTKLVLEFPQLQGIAGRQYAQLDQLPSEVCQAIEEHYWPKFSGDQLPNTSLSAYLALA